jgi:hypothetical protein
MMMKEIGVCGVGGGEYSRQLCARSFRAVVLSVSPLSLALTSSIGISESDFTNQSDFTRRILIDSFDYSSAMTTYVGNLLTLVRMEPWRLSSFLPLVITSKYFSNLLENTPSTNYCKLMQSLGLY